MNTLLKIATVVAMFTISAAHALNISPIKMEIMPGQRAMQLNIENTSDQIKTYDIRIKRWDGVDQLTGRAMTSHLPADEAPPILLSKPVVTLMAHGKATVRLAVAHRTPGALSDFYRIFVDDITPAETHTKSETGAYRESNAEISLSVSLPLQVRIKPGTRGNLTDSKNGALMNTGDNVLTILSAKNPDGTSNNSINRYLFPGERWVTDFKLDQISWLAGIQ